MTKVTFKTKSGERVSFTAKSGGQKSKRKKGKSTSRKKSGLSAAQKRKLSQAAKRRPRHTRGPKKGQFK